jgi:hypothetical protein
MSAVAPEITYPWKADDIVKAVADRPLDRDVMEVYVIRYRKALVKYRWGGETTDHVCESLSLQDGEPTWTAYPAGGSPLPFISLTGLEEHRLWGDDPFLAELYTWWMRRNDRLEATL